MHNLNNGHPHSAKYFLSSQIGALKLHKAPIHSTKYDVINDLQYIADKLSQISNEVDMCVNI